MTVPSNRHTRAGWVKDLREFLGNDKPPKTFDDVASDRAKNARAFISEAAEAALIEAADFAANGDVGAAQKAHQEYAALRHLAFAIPLDMVERGL